METYPNQCPVCNKETEDINNFYCIKNRGRCERCLTHKRNMDIYKQKTKAVDNYILKMKKNAIIKTGKYTYS